MHLRERRKGVRIVFAVCKGRFQSSLTSHPLPNHTLLFVMIEESIPRARISNSVEKSLSVWAVRSIYRGKRKRGCVGVVGREVRKAYLSILGIMSERSDGMVPRRMLDEANKAVLLLKKKLDETTQTGRREMDTALRSMQM